MDAIAHGKVVLAAIFGSGSISALDYADKYLVTDHFEDRTQKRLFSLALLYAAQVRGVMPRKTLSDALRGYPPGTALQYEEYYDLVAAMRVGKSDFRYSVMQLRELRQARLTGEALSQSMVILREGATHGGQELRGHADARRHALAAFAEAEREAMHGEAPEGDIRAAKETAKVAEAFARARERRISGQSAGIGTGIARLDDALSGGLANGEFALIAGFSSAGKSQWCAHQAWHACVQQGKSVVLFASETTRSNMQVRILGRHSRLPKFGLQAGLNTKDIRAGTLDMDEYRAFQAVLADFSSSRYGRCYIVQLPKGSTLSVVEGRLAAISRQFMPDLVIIDYLALLRPERAGRERRDDLALLLQDAKVMATSFADGRGIPLVSPWQVNREGRKEVRSRGHYVMSELAETAEAERSPDIIISILDPETDDTRGRKVPLKLDVMKNRENERFVRMELLADFANSHFTEAGAEDALPSGLWDDES
jgi:replicative DNA helicase